MQAVLNNFGITHVTTRFAKARQYSPPVHARITWECGVAILERGLSPVEWHQMAAFPETLALNPVVALHWGNLLHADPDRNGEIVERWAARLLVEAAGFGRILSEDVADCWRQAAVYYCARVRLDDRAVVIDLRGLPPLSSVNGPFSLKIREKHQRAWRCSGAEIVSCRTNQDRISTVRLQPMPGCQEIRIDLL